MIADADIFQVRKYNAIAMNASSRKTTRPWMDCCVTSAPQDGPMNVDATSVVGTL